MLMSINTVLVLKKFFISNDDMYSIVMDVDSYFSSIIYYYTQTDRY